ncbi:hypothetical protein ATANTOWER_004048 [Ataeniobius toweri]|uniref:Uncharacterized protein n=1 Tax=Ataeniobius toweri TaxID=208326 RepID=A0ABU7B4L7_9TELE|nr:hypothetical protein [Ataeniobius toweri]
MLLQVELRKLSESLWRKTKLQVHFDFCKESLHVFNQELNRTRQFFVSDVIRLITLFPVVDSGPRRPAVCVSPSDNLINTCVQLLLGFNLVDGTVTLSSAYNHLQGKPLTYILNVPVNCGKINPTSKQMRC